MRMFIMLFLVKILVVICGYSDCTIAAQQEGSNPPNSQLSSKQVLILENELINQRLAVKSGHVYLHVMLYEPSKSEGVKPKEYFIEVWFEDDKWRSDYFSGDRTGVIQRSIYTDDWYINESSSAQPIAMYGKETKPPSVPVQLVDPRKIGVVAWNLETQRQLDIERVFTRTDRENFSFSREHRDGKDILKSQFVVRGKFGKTLFSYEMLSNKRGYFPILVSNRDLTPQAIGMRLDNEYAAPFQRDVWLPSKTHFQYFDNQKVTMEEFVEVYESEFNLDINDKIFTLEGMLLQPGRAVIMDNRMKVWASGGHLIDEIKGADVNYNSIDASEPEPKQFRFWILLANGIVFSFLAVFFLAKKYFNSRT